MKEQRMQRAPYLWLNGVPGHHWALDLPEHNNRAVSLGPEAERECCCRVSIWTTLTDKLLGVRPQFRMNNGNTPNMPSRQSRLRRLCPASHVAAGPQTVSDITLADLTRMERRRYVGWMETSNVEWQKCIGAEVRLDSVIVRRVRWWASITQTPSCSR